MHDIFHLQNCWSMHDFFPFMKLWYRTRFFIWKIVVGQCFFFFICQKKIIWIWIWQKKNHLPNCWWMHDILHLLNCDTAHDFSFAKNSWSHTCMIFFITKNCWWRINDFFSFAKKKCRSMHDFIFFSLWNCDDIAHNPLTTKRIS